MRRFVTKYVNAYLNCAYYKSKPATAQGKLHPIEKTPIHFHTLHIDHVRPFETSRSQNKFVLVIVDAFSKFTVIETVRNQMKKHVVKVLQDLIALFGIFVRINSNRGTAYTSLAFRLFCQNYEIKYKLNAMETPRFNGRGEQYNKTIVSALTKTVAGT